MWADSKARQQCCLATCSLLQDGLTSSLSFGSRIMPPSRCTGELNRTSWVNLSSNDVGNARVSQLLVVLVWSVRSEWLNSVVRWKAEGQCATHGYLTRASIVADKQKKAFSSSLCQSGKADYIIYINFLAQRKIERFQRNQSQSWWLESRLLWAIMPTWELELGRILIFFALSWILSNW